jgi:chromosome segregation ATPase
MSKAPPLPEPPLPGGPSLVPPRVGSSANDLAAVRAHAAELEQQLHGLSDELAARDASIADLEQEARELREECTRRAGEIARADRDRAEVQGLLEDSAQRIDVLEARLRAELDHRRELEAELEANVRSQEELLRRAAAPADRHAREMEVARSLIDNLETECSWKESKLATLQSELQTLRTILRHVDPRAVDLAHRRMAGRGRS